MNNAHLKSLEPIREEEKDDVTVEYPSEVSPGIRPKNLSLDEKAV